MKFNPVFWAPMMILSFIAFAVMDVTASRQLREAESTNNYPSVPPAGYCIVTDGEEFGFRYPLKGRYGISYAVIGGDESAEKSTEWAWRMYEYGKRPHAEKPEKPEGIWRPTDLELCKNDNP